MLIDRELFRFEEIWAAAGHPHAVFRLRPQDLEALDRRAGGGRGVTSHASTLAERAAPCARAATCRRPASRSAAWTRPAACAKAACARSTRSPPGAAWTTRPSAAVWLRIELRAQASSPRRAACHEAHHLLPRLHLALRLPGVRAAAGGARGPELQRALPAGAVRRAAQAPRPARARPRSRPSATGPTARCCGSATRTASRSRCRPRIPSTRCRTCGSRWPRRRTATSTATWPRPSSATSGAAAPKPAMPARLAALAAQPAAGARRRRRRGQGAAQGQHRRGHRARRVRRADLRGRRPPVLGLRRLPMLRAYLDGDAWFDGPRLGPAPTSAPVGLLAHANALSSRFPHAETQRCGFHLSRQHRFSFATSPGSVVASKNRVTSHAVGRHIHRRRRMAATLDSRGAPHSAPRPMTRGGEESHLRLVARHRVRVVRLLPLRLARGDHRQAVLHRPGCRRGLHLRAAGLRRRLPGAALRRARVRPPGRHDRAQVHLPGHHPDHGPVDLHRRPAAQLRDRSASRRRSS